MFDPSPRDRALVDSVYETNGDFLSSTDHVEDTVRSAAPDRIAEVSAETGHPAYIVRSRGIAWCRKNPIRQRDEFDQTLPDSFDTDVVEANASDADALITESRTARRPADNDTPSVAPPAAKILPNGSVIFTAPNGVAYVAALHDGALAVTAHTPDAAPAALEWEAGSGLNGWVRLSVDQRARRAA